MIIKNPGSTTFWIDPIKNPLAFKDDNKIHWITFELNEVLVEVTSEGTMFLLEINKGTKESVCIFKRDFKFPLDKKTFIAITWSNEQVRLYVDAKMQEEISIIDF